jgi:hypothetical protein
MPNGRAQSAWTSSAALIAWMLFVVATLAPRLTDVQVNRNKFPVAAMQFVHDRQLTGNFLSELNWGQYLIGCFAEDPRWAATSRVAVDGRLRTCYPWETLDTYFDFALGDGGPDLRNRSPGSPPFDDSRILKLGHPDFVLLHRQQQRSIEAMSRHSAGWTLLYQDQVAQLWGRTDRFDKPSSPDYLPPAARWIGDAPQIGTVTWPALPQATQSNKRVVQTPVAQSRATLHRRGRVGRLGRTGDSAAVPTDLPIALSTVPTSTYRSSQPPATLIDSPSRAALYSGPLCRCTTL